jgi:hypothetical protein
MRRVSYLALLLVLVCVSCSANTAGNATQSATVQAPVVPTDTTPTPAGMGGEIVPPTQSVDICAGLGGSLEMQVLIGPSDAVGLEPVAVGNIPFTIVSNDGINIAQGSGPITYQDILVEDWGTYTVSFDMVASVSGACEESEQGGVLNLFISTNGEQLVEVEAQGFQGSYPWAGSPEIDISLPIEEGATPQGEGWAFVLHLD